MELGNQSNDGFEKLRPALEQIANHEPRRHVGRSRSFTNWQNAYFELQAIAKRALTESRAS